MSEAYRTVDLMGREQWVEREVTLDVSTATLDEYVIEVLGGRT